MTILLFLAFSKNDYVADFGPKTPLKTQETSLCYSNQIERKETENRKIILFGSAHISFDNRRL